MIKGEVWEISATEREKNLCRLRGDNLRKSNQFTMAIAITQCRYQRKAQLKELEGKAKC